MMQHELEYFPGNALHSFIYKNATGPTVNNNNLKKATHNYFLSCKTKQKLESDLILWIETPIRRTYVKISWWWDLFGEKWGKKCWTVSAWKIKFGALALSEREMVINDSKLRKSRMM